MNPLFLSRGLLPGNLSDDGFALGSAFVGILYGVHGSIAESFSTRGVQHIGVLVESEEGVHQVTAAAQII